MYLLQTRAQTENCTEDDKSIIIFFRLQSCSPQLIKKCLRKEKKVSSGIVVLYPTKFHKYCRLENLFFSLSSSCWLAGTQEIERYAITDF